MQTSLSLSLDKRRIRKDNSYPIIIRLGHFQKTTSIATGQSVPEAFWDDRKKQVKRAYKGVESVSFLNNLLRTQLAKANEIVNALHFKGELDFMSIVEIKDRIVGKTKYVSFYKFGYSQVDKLKESQRYGTARNYEGVLGVLKKFTKDRDLKFNELNYQFLLRFERYHLSKPGNTLNGIASYMRTIKAIYNKGIKEGHVQRDSYPFLKYQIKTAPTQKRAIDLEYIKSILQLTLEKNDPLFHYRNYFLLSYMTMGMSFVDMAFLKRHNIRNDRLKFQRRKTSKAYDIKLTPQLMEILKFYLKKKKRMISYFP